MKFITNSLKVRGEFVFLQSPLLFSTSPVWSLSILNFLSFNKCWNDKHWFLWFWKLRKCLQSFFLLLRHQNNWQLIVLIERLSVIVWQTVKFLQLYLSHAPALCVFWLNIVRCLCGSGLHCLYTSVWNTCSLIIFYNFGYFHWVVYKMHIHKNI